MDLKQLPGVRSVAGTTNIPLNGEFGSGSMWRTDAPGAQGRTPPTSAANQWRAAIHVVTPGYFETLGIPVVRGRTFDERDRFPTEKLARESEPKPAGVIIINEAMAKRYWPGADPIGSTLFLFDDHVFAAYRTVVGIVRDVRAESVAEATMPTVFLPFGQHPGRGLSLVLRADLAPSQMVGTVMGRLKAFDPEVVVADVRPFDAVVGVALSRPRFTLLLVGSFALLAISIAFVGVFGIVGFLVTRRTQEIGIRMALGAHPSRVLWLVLREGLRPVLLGVLVGGGAAVAMARSMQALLYGIAPLDGVSFVSAAALILVASIVAAALPASRATGVDPLRALRAE
jgi:putative ABC transport system permease protein